MRFTALAIVVFVAACTLPSRPTMDCRGDSRFCEWAATAASGVLPSGKAKWVIVGSRSPATLVHAEVHACYADGRYLAVNVIGPDDLTRSEASVPYEPPGDPPCRLGPLISPTATPVEELVQLDLGRLEVNHPANWEYHEFEVAFSFDSVQGYLTTGPFGPEKICTRTRGAEDRGPDFRYSLSCDFSGHPVEPGGVVVGFEHFATLDGFSARPGETQATVGGMPAYFSEARVGDTLTLTWRVRTPSVMHNGEEIEVKMREPGTDASRRQVEAMIASLRFDPPPTILPTSGPEFDRGAGEAAAQALDTLRTYVDSAGYACFVPPEPDVTRTAEVEVVPQNRRLSQPLDVTCTTLAEADADMWRIRFVLEWSASDDHGAGRQETEVWVNAAEEAGYTMSGDEPPGEVPSVPTSE